MGSLLSLDGKDQEIDSVVGINAGGKILF